VARRFFNVLAEEPEVVAADIVPKVRAVSGTNSAIEFLTLPDAVRRVVTGWGLYSCSIHLNPFDP
jgi:chlorophyll(ide) b reductase